MCRTVVGLGNDADGGDCFNLKLRPLVVQVHTTSMYHADTDGGRVGSWLSF